METERKKILILHEWNPWIKIQLRLNSQTLGRKNKSGFDREAVRSQLQITVLLRLYLDAKWSSIIFFFSSFLFSLRSFYSFLSSARRSVRNCSDRHSACFPGSQSFYQSDSEQSCKNNVYGNSGFYWTALCKTVDKAINSSSSSHSPFLA